MTIDEKYFPGFTQKWIETEPGIVINTLIGGSGNEAVLLVHGHPETHLMWRFLTPELAKHYTVVITDLRGYGDSSKPEGLPDHSNYSKRALADDQVKVMKALGFERFHVAGHDRGARVLHRMIIDHPEKIKSCTLMDIIATYDMYKETNEEFATKYWHWFFYIQGKGFPETALSAYQLQSEFEDRTCRPGQFPTGRTGRVHPLLQRHPYRPRHLRRLPRQCYD